MALSHACLLREYNHLNISEIAKTPIVLPWPAGKVGALSSRFFVGVFRNVLVAFLAVFSFYLSLVTTSAPMSGDERSAVERAVAVLEAKGFADEVFLLRNVTTFRGGDNWLNQMAASENAYAATNYPFGIITIYPDFYNKAADDTERAMILLHEAQHLLNKAEPEAYQYVWTERHRLGWTTLSHGTTPTFVTVELQTREHAPQLFTCPSKVWNDCTETLAVNRESVASSR